MKKILIYIALVLCALPAPAQQADQLYAAKEYEKAASAYLQTIKDKGESAEIYYDLGNCYYHLNDYASAVLSYRKALAIDPYLSQADNNLQLIRQKVIDKNQAEMRDRKGTMQPEEPTFFRAVYNFIAVDNSSDMWARIAVCCFVLFAICVVLYVIPRAVPVRKIGFFGGFIMLICSLVMLVFACLASSADRFGNVAIVKQLQVVLKSEPSAAAEDKGTPICSGTELKIIEQRKDVDGNQWSLVRLNADNEGWLHQGQFYTFPDNPKSNK